jgi:methionine biosynthesis protein MetW
MSRTLRSDLMLVADWIEPGSSVLDLGCGDGSLLAYLQEEKGCRCYGVEIDDANVLAGIENGVNIIQQNLEEGLAMFSDKSFDTVLELQSLQVVRQTEKILREIGRVGRSSIVTFPNFAYWRNRIALVGGRMPVTKTLPYEWYDTPNLRFSTLEDFADLARQSGFEIVERMALHEGRRIDWLPNLRGSLAVFRLHRVVGSPAPDEPKRIDSPSR